MLMSKEREAKTCGWCVKKNVTLKRNSVRTTCATRPPFADGCKQGAALTRACSRGTFT